MNRIGLSLSLALLTAGCTHIGPGQAQLGGGKYVAMGSSFAAGAGIGATKPDTPERCQRAVNNYPTLLAQRLSLQLDDRSCGGARIEHLLGPWEELPPQVDAITADTRLVTVTVGGNDLHYVGNLFMAGCDPEKGLRLDEQAIPCQEQILPGDEDYAKVESRLKELGEEVRRRAPNTTLVFVQYLTLVPENTCPVLGLSEEQANEFRALGQRLAEVTRQAARETDALVLDANRLSDGHTACDPAPWSKAAPNPEDKSPGAPWHPNATGHARIAEALATLLSD